MTYAGPTHMTAWVIDHYWFQVSNGCMGYASLRRVGPMIYHYRLSAGPGTSVKPSGVF